MLAYLAGVIDSDGYITINRSTRNGVVYFGAVIGVSGTRRQPHDLAASLWGGKVGYHQPKNPRHRGQFLWSRQGKAAATAILEVMPYLRIKVDQAWLALELNEHVLSGQGDDPFPWFSPDYDPRPYREDLVTSMRSLNQSRKAAGRELDGRTWDEYPNSLPPVSVALSTEEPK